MRYVVIVMLDTERPPVNIIAEVVSTLEFDAVTHTLVNSAVALTDDGEQVAVYDGNATKGGVI